MTREIHAFIAQGTPGVDAPAPVVLRLEEPIASTESMLNDRNDEWLTRAVASHTENARRVHEALNVLPSGTRIELLRLLLQDFSEKLGMGARVVR